MSESPIYDDTQKATRIDPVLVCQVFDRIVTNYKEHVRQVMGKGKVYDERYSTDPD